MHQVSKDTTKVDSKSTLFVGKSLLRKMLLGIVVVAAYFQFWGSNSHFETVSSSSNTHSKSKFTPIVWAGSDESSQLPHSVDSMFSENGLVNYTSENDWMHAYIGWHTAMRHLHPDNHLFEDPDAPNIVVVYNCDAGGLNDRMTALSAMLYKSFVEHRILLIKWYSPADLENFLMPNILNWTVPRSLLNHTLLENPCGNDPNNRHNDDSPLEIEVTKKIMLRARRFYNNEEPVGHFNIAWHALFVPSTLVQLRLESEMERMGLYEGQYNAIHCRVRHPAHFPDSTAGIIPQDHGGANYSGDERELAIKTAIHAIECSNWISLKTANIANAQKTDPIYFMSDAEQLVHSVIRLETPKDSLEARLQNISLISNVVGRINKEKIRHIGDGQGGSMESYLTTFVDLYLAASARCVALGVGNFGSLATRISGTKCVVDHENIPQKTKRKWAMGRDGVQECKLQDV